MIEELTGISTEVDLASEFRYRNPIIGRNILTLAISQSGETADTLAAVRLSKSKGSKVLAICNVVGSTLTREADAVLYIRAGCEIGVASTKAFSAQLCACLILALYIAKLKGISYNQEIIIKELMQIPQKLDEILSEKISSNIKECARRYYKYKNFLYLARGINYPIALEGALKLKEISYIHAEGYAGGEMKHGPIALIDENMPTVAIATYSKTYQKMVSNIVEVKSRDGAVIALATVGNKDIKDIVDYVIYVPETIELLSPILNTIPLQLLAYYIAVKRGCDVDQPRNLAKSVTVE
jgi:glucosamine--fructose-6-phosphate aminotransferase (isomerizing)